jgi:predicted dehydrogenase
MSETPVRLVLVGVGGMGGVYVSALLDRIGAGEFRIAGAVDPEPARCPRLAELQALGVPFFVTLSDFYDTQAADLAIVSSPIQFHAEQTVLALERGSHVLCEKPLAATTGEAAAMREAQDRSGRWVAVGYQWSFSRAVQDLKLDIRSGRLGRPRRLSCLYLWPRDEAYYRRSGWAGRIKDDAGRWVLDGPANNAMAHDLHNMFYLLGDRTERSAAPVEVQAELYRANAVENYDTAALRAGLAGDVEILFFVSHASRRDLGPVLSYNFEDATVLASGRGSDLKSFFHDGTVKSYGSPDAEPMKKLWDAIRTARSGESPVCGIEAASAQTLCINGMQESADGIGTLPAELIRVEEAGGSRRTWVQGLDDVLELGYAESKLPAEAAVAWARPGRPVDLVRFGGLSGDLSGRGRQ